MTTETQKRAEWERLLVGSRLSRNGDLPEYLRELLRKLDEQLGTGKSNQDD
jgi:hypothetical protein